MGATFDPLLGALRTTDSTTGSFLSTTAVKTTSYSAAVGDFVPVDLTSGSVTITLPNAPADKSQVGVKLVTPMTGNLLTVSASGSDTFNDPNRGQTLELVDANQTVVLQYQASTHTWYETVPTVPSGVFMPRAQAALTNAHRLQTSFFGVGSSTMFGTGAATTVQRWTDVAGTVLHRIFNFGGTYGGRHILAVDTGSGTWSPSGTITTVSGGFSLQSKQMSAGATMTITVNNCTRVEVLYMQTVATNTATINIDGTGAVSINPATTGTNTFDGVFTSSALTRGTHTIVITASATFTFDGLYVQDNESTNSSGVRMYNSGKSGAVTSDFTADSTVLQRAGTLSDVAGIFMELGPNEWANNVSPATFETNLRSLISTYQSGLTSTVPDICLIINHRRLDLSSPTYDWDDYAQKMYAVASSIPGVYIMDMRPYFPTVNDATHDPQDILSSDNVHPTTAGHALYARVFTTKLSQGVLAPGLLDTSSTYTGNTLTLTNGAEIGANGLTVYNTSDRITNYERFKMQYNANVATFTSESGGTGTVRDINFVTPNRSLRIVDTGNSSGVYRMTVGSGQANSVGLALTGTYNGTGTQVAQSIAPTINQSGSSAYTVLLVNVTESATGSGNKRLLDLQVGSTTKFNVANDGTVTLADAANIVAGTSTGTKIGTGTTQKIGFYNATPVVQQNTTGTTTGFTAGAGSAVDSAATFTGGVGSTAYTIGDVVKALKNLGLMAQ